MLVSAPRRHEVARMRPRVQQMFNEIAHRYDFLNHLLSMGLDRGWRARALRLLEWTRNPEGRFLDVCAGTLDVSVALASDRGFRGEVIAVDFSESMLRGGTAKRSGLPVHPVAGDAMRLPVRDASCAGAIVAFGIRNVAEMDLGLREMTRVLAPSARLVILEFTTPPSAPVRMAYHAYFHHVVPLIGGWISGKPDAYRYLPESVAAFPAPHELAQRMRDAGLTEVSWSMLTLGVAAIHTGRKPG
jgi:demethylmenaquinone methyltransferase/2-methoxy-6-polyprenyl-1,4-benzoquinol methylase